MTVLPKEDRRGYQISGTGVTDGFNSPSGCWESNPSPLKQLFLTVQLSLQAPINLPIYVRVPCAMVFV